MTVVEQAVAAMEQAKQEILKLRQENAVMLACLKSMRRTLRELGGDPMPTLDAIIARSEASHEL